MFVELLELGVEAFVCGLLPVGGGGVAEENAAAEGADSVDGAELVELEGAAGCGEGCGELGFGKVVEECGELEGGEVEAVAVGFEVAAAAGHFAFGTAGVDLGGDAGVEGVDGGGDVIAPGGSVNCFN